MGARSEGENTRRQGAVNRSGRWLAGILLVGGVVSTCVTGPSLSGCSTQPEQGKATEKIFVEDLDLERFEGRYQLEFTLVNGYHLSVTSVDILLTYRDFDGKVVGTFKTKLPGQLEAHDAVRKLGVDGGPILIGGDKVAVEITKARTTLVRKQ